MTLQEKMEELWDKYSEHIDDNSDSFQMVAGNSVIKRNDFFKLLNEFLPLIKAEKSKPFRAEIDTSLFKKVSDMTVLDLQVLLEGIQFRVK
jgi:hypothetical protein